MQKGLTESEINATCSGSTFVSVFFDNDEIVCANVGDSRAILARQSIFYLIQLIAKVGNSFTFPKTISQVLRAKKRGF